MPINVMEKVSINVSIVVFLSNVKDTLHQWNFFKWPNVYNADLSLRAMVSTLILDGPCKWKLKQKFWKGIVVEMDKIQVQSPWFQH
jgi:hypothetical protein